MIQQLGEKWRSFWRRTNRLLLAMDADPLEDIHRRLRQLEAANLTPKAARYGTAPPGAIREGDGRQQGV
jgi:hypothetical protein